MTIEKVTLLIAVIPLFPLFLGSYQKNELVFKSHCLVKIAVKAC